MGNGVQIIVKIAKNGKGQGSTELRLGEEIQPLKLVAQHVRVFTTTRVVSALPFCFKRSWRDIYNA